MIKSHALILLILALFGSSHAISQEQGVSVNEQFHSYKLSGPFLTAPELNGLPSDSEFSIEHYQKSNFPNQHAYWHKIKITNEISDIDGVRKSVNLMFRSSNIRFIEVSLFVDGYFYKQAHMGALEVPKSEVFSRAYFSFEMERGHEYELLIRKKSHGPANLGMILMSDAALEEHQSNRHVISGAYIFSVICLFLYVLALSIFSKNLTTIHYILFYIYTIVSTFVLNGLSKDLFPDWIYTYLTTHINSMSIVGMTLMCSMVWRYLDSHSRSNMALITFTISTCIACLLLSLVVRESYGYVFSFVSLLAGGTYVTISCFNAIKMKSHTSIFILLCWLSIVTGVIVNSLSTHGLIQDNYYTINAYTIHMMVVAMIVTIAITDWTIFEYQRRIIAAYKDPNNGLPSHTFLMNSFEKSVKRKIEKSDNDAWIYVVKLSGIGRLTNIFGVEAARLIKQQFIGRLSEAFNDVKGLVNIPVSQRETTQFVSVPGGNIAFIVNESSSNHLIKEALTKMEDPFQIMGVDVSITISTGFNRLYDAKSSVVEDIKSCYLKANQALVNAIRSGRHFLPYEDASESEHSSTVKMVKKLSTAIQRRELQIHIQPQYCSNKEILGGEVLIRWHDEELGNVSPSVFIVLAEEAGMIFGITRLAIEKSFKWVSENREVLPQGFHLSINLSAIDLQNNALYTLIERQLQKFSVPASLFIFEITETAYSDSPHALRSGISKLKKIGVRIAIDDFGTGYSSLAYLRDIEPDYVKIDMSFIQGIHKSEVQQQFVRAIVDMALAVDAEVVSEGIEFEEDLDTAIKLGSNYYQGYISGKPIIAKDFIQTFL